jgi:hypothetical protein
MGVDTFRSNHSVRLSSDLPHISLYTPLQSSRDGDQRVLKSGLIPPYGGLNVQRSQSAHYTSSVSSSCPPRHRRLTSASEHISHRQRALTSGLLLPFTLLVLSQSLIQCLNTYRRAVQIPFELAAPVCFTDAMLICRVLEEWEASAAQFLVLFNATGTCLVALLACIPGAVIVTLELEAAL